MLVEWIAPEATGRLQIKPSGSGDENAHGLNLRSCAKVVSSVLLACRYVRRTLDKEVKV